MDYSDFRESERRGWSDRANDYDNATARATTQSVPALLAAVKLYHGARLLDAGCGPGYVAGAAAALGAEASGIDFSARMIEAAMERFPKISFEIGDVEHLPVSDSCYDAVVSNIVLFHVTNPGAAVSEAFRVLKPGGRFAFSQWLGPDRSALYKDLLGIVSSRVDMAKAEAAPDAFDLSDQTRATAVLEDVGFEEIGVARVDNILRAPAHDFYGFFMRFGVRIPSIMASQSSSVQEVVRAEVNEHFEQYRCGDEIHAPMPSVVYSGRRPPHNDHRTFDEA